MFSYQSSEFSSEFAELADCIDSQRPGTLFSPHMIHHTANSPSQNFADTPAESVAFSINYQSSVDSEFDAYPAGDDSYYSPIFGTVGGNGPAFLDIDAFDSSDATATAAAVSLVAGDNLHTYTTPEPIFNNNKAYPISPDQTPSLNVLASPAYTAGPAPSSDHTAFAQKNVACDIDTRRDLGGFDGVVSPKQLTKAHSTHTIRNMTTSCAPQLQDFNDTAIQLTPEATSSGGSSGKSNGRSSFSTDGAATTTTAPPMSNHKPQVTVSLWDRDSAHQEENYLSSSDIKTERAGSNADDRPTRQGVDPLSRPSAELVTSVNEDAEARKVDKQNLAVSQWLDSANGGDPDVHGSPTGRETAFEGVSNRDVELGGDTKNVEQAGRSYFTGHGGPLTTIDHEIMLASGVWEDSPSVLHITQSVRHQPESSQAAIERFERMYHDNVSFISRAATWGTRRHSLPSIADFEGVTSGNLLKKLTINRNETPRRTSIFDNLRTLVHKPSPSQTLKRSRGIPDGDASPLHADRSTRASEEGRRDSTKSTSTLGLPPRTQSWGKNKQPMPSINDALVSMGSNMASIGTTHTRNGSIGRPHAGSLSLSPPLTSPKSPLLKVSNSLRRPRSKSDTKGGLDNPHSNLVRMLKKTGGLPVASLATANVTPMFPGPTSAPVASVPITKPVPFPSPTPAPIHIPATQTAVADIDDDDDDDDEVFDNGDLLNAETDELIDKITPDFNGFRELVLGLNPMLTDVNSYLVDRIAHQQTVRYKGLLNNRIKHLGQVVGRQCPSGALCVAQGGAAVSLTSKGAPRNGGSHATLYDGEVADDAASTLVGAVHAESFPKYIPMPPTTNLPAQFECQLCFTIKRFQKPSDWTKHVHEDVQPFTCTWERCREPKIFKRKADWVRHENEGHRRLEWWTCDVEDCRHTCYRRDNFLQHLVREHKFDEPKHKTKAIIKKYGAPDSTWQRVEQCHAETTARPQDEPCRFCAKTFPSWKSLIVHLAKHMEHISLPLLRLVEQKEVEADTLISPVQDPPPRTFPPISAYPATADAQHGTISEMSPNRMAGQVSGADFHQLGQPLSYGQLGTQDSNSFMYPVMAQVQYQSPSYFGQQSQFAMPDVLPSHMQSLNAAAMNMQSTFAGAQAYPGLLPVTTGGHFVQTGNHYITDPVGMVGTSSFTPFTTAEELGLQAPMADESQLQYDASIECLSAGPASSLGHGAQCRCSNAHHTLHNDPFTGQ
ncbi:hypothetical protein SEPCBS57363_001244 [Sporothrix epigloea]|uniref:C2H2-type domain-containing protein n=1 Tax=Sporothrix epigloea TaxID=1892477 RepID=A0ABP0DC49_9PEZI